MRVAIYARYSSDQQRSASIADQLRVCRAYAVTQKWHVVGEYTDAAASGASLMRPGIQALLRDALRHSTLDVVLAESLDRFSRDQEDTAGVFKRLTFAGVRMVTLAEGDVGHLHVGLKGTMNALYLQDLRQKTHRGLWGRVEEGKSAGGISYGYRVIRVLDGQSRGDREIHAAEAEIVRRIFLQFVDGVSAKAIARALNGAGLRGPAGSAWSPSTIHGHAGRGTGILNNELYIGRLVWNRLRYVKDPDTGRRVSRLNPSDAWLVREVPHLRIIDDELWQAAKVRQARARRTTSIEGLVRNRRPRYLFSGLTKCGECGGGYILSSHEHLVCFNARERGTCTNRRRISRAELESRVLTAMRERLFDPGCFAEFCQSFTEEMNQLRREHLAALAGTKREFASVERRLSEIVKAIGDGFRTESMKTELIALEAKKVELAAALKVPPMPALHPNMAETFRQKATALQSGLQDETQCESARKALRGFIDSIVIPREGLLRVVGNLGTMLAAGQPKGGFDSVGIVGCGGGI